MLSLLTVSLNATGGWTKLKKQPGYPGSNTVLLSTIPSIIKKAKNSIEKYWKNRKKYAVKYSWIKFVNWHRIFDLNKIIVEEILSTGHNNSIKKKLRKNMKS